MEQVTARESGQQCGLEQRSGVPRTPGYWHPIVVVDDTCARIAAIERQKRRLVLSHRGSQFCSATALSTGSLHRQRYGNGGYFRLLKTSGAHSKATGLIYGSDDPQSTDQRRIDSQFIACMIGVSFATASTQACFGVSNISSLVLEPLWVITVAFRLSHTRMTVTKARVHTPTTHPCHVPLTCRPRTTDLPPNSRGQDCNMATHDNIDQGLFYTRIIDIVQHQIVPFRVRGR